MMKAKAKAKAKKPKSTKKKTAPKRKKKEAKSKMNQQEAEVLAAAKKKLREQDEYIKALSAQAAKLGTIVSIEGASSVVSVGSELVNVQTPANAIIGKRAKILPQTGQVLEIQEPLGVGAIATVRTVENGSCEIDFENSTRRVFYPVDHMVLEIGNRVILDQSQSVVVSNLGCPKDEHIFEENLNVTWDMISGLEAAKQELIEAIELQGRYPELFKKFGKKPLKGCQLYGPPGCGKTMLAKAVATALSGASGGGFLYVKGPEILSKWVGEAERNIRNLFQQGRRHYEKTKTPAVMFIDEADSVLKRRGSGHSSDIETTIVPMFLSEWDGLEDSHCFIILATNRPDTLDEAVVREGRIDRKIYVGRPNDEAVMDMFKRGLSNIPIDGDLGVISLMATARVFECWEIKAALSGALIANLIDRASTLSLKRSIALSGDVSGVSLQDIEAALKIMKGEYGRIA